MAEICTGDSAAEASAAAVLLGDPSSRSARRRRIEIRRHRLVADADTIAPLPATREDDPRLFEKRPRIGRCDTDGCITTGVADPSSTKLSSEQQPLDKGLPYGVTSVIGRRREMEDAFTVKQNFTKRGSGKYHFFGVYDGHGCSHVSLSCKDRMHEIVSSELGLSSRSEWKEVMERSFRRMDMEVATASKSRSKPGCRSPECDLAGSTAVVAIVGADEIVVANAGDSRAVLCRNGAAVPLSVDHKPDRPDERQRIEAAGGRVIYWDGARVLGDIGGGLAMSRAIGDAYLKPFVMAEPEVTVTEREEGDECLILASDGLWDVVTNEMACYIVKMCMRSGDTAEDDLLGSKKACSDATMLLTKLAMARGSTDNISVVVVDVRKNS